MPPIPQLPHALIVLPLQGLIFGGSGVQRSTQQVVDVAASFGTFDPLVLLETRNHFENLKTMRLIKKLPLSFYIRDHENKNEQIVEDSFHLHYPYNYWFQFALQGTSSAIRKFINIGNFFGPLRDLWSSLPPHLEEETPLEDPSQCQYCDHR